ncbi:PAS domain-containing sensor histidine kinase [Natrarchaeobaculum aegyptiacum]|uniref:histidine kinase n=1 Tax=Natrarchaeobaculum aegyptiacum TaxID=745377 RepID=A0A2Z2HTX1_9EURY|nr:PAS domain S-box protein [Natrarchaeobaculum aegyptiacum]ARS88877.1 hypothetical protein B1756_03310 [Natrarchaeobaculum aegyptiacum]
MDGLQDRTQLFQLLVDGVEEYAIFTLDADGCVQTWNLGAERIKGYEADDILGEHVSTFYTEAAITAGVPETNLAEATTRGAIEDEGWRVRADGSRFWASVSITAIRDETDDLVGFAKITRDMTDRRRYERQLQQQAARLERHRDRLEQELDEVYERISDGFYAVDDEFRIQYLNDRAMNVLGIDETAIGEPFFSVVVTTESFEAAMREAVETNDVVTMEDYYDPVDRWFDNAIYPSKTGLSVYFREITDQKRRERELEQYRQVVETVDDGIYVLDDDRRFVMVNEGFAATTGYDREDLIGERAETVFGDEFVDIANEYQDALESGDQDVAVLEEALYRADGTTITVESRFARYEFDDQTTGRVGVTRDVSERRRRERQQRIVAELGQFALESDDVDELMGELTAKLSEGLDVEGCIAFEFDGRSRLTCREQVGWDDVLAPTESIDATALSVDRILETERPVVEDVESTSAPRRPALLERRGIRSGITTVIGSPEDPWGVLGGYDSRQRSFTAQDVTFVQSVANVLAEAIERQQYQRRLEDLVDDLEESNERLEQFAYVASHDLQEPLRMVSSYLQLVEDRYGDALDEDGEEFIAFATDGADRMREMIDGLLEYSRVQTQGQPLEPVALNDVVETVRRDLQVSIDEHEAEIVVEDLPRVVGDTAQLRQLFLNLLENAIAYSGDEPPRVHVSAERDRTRSGDEWVVSVRDEGVGIDPDHADRIFDVFERLVSHDEHPGTGIGLALCKRVVERHGGEIWVESEPGEGSTFSFTLSAVDEA